MLEKAKLADTCRLRAVVDRRVDTDEGAWVYLLLRQYQIPYRVFPDKMKLARILQRECTATRLYPPGTLASVTRVSCVCVCACVCIYMYVHTSADVPSEKTNATEKKISRRQRQRANARQTCNFCSVFRLFTFQCDERIRRHLLRFSRDRVSTSRSVPK